MNMRGFLILGLTAVFTLVTGDEPPKGTCPANTHYMECGTSCPKTCTDVTSQRQSQTICTLACVSGCFCDDGYIFENMTSKRCIPSSDCKQTCQANSEYVECGTACPLTCENYRNPSLMCTMQCVPGCACTRGYVLESATSKNCIPPRHCKMTCQDQAHPTDCGTACPLTCDNYNDPPACTLQCVAGCFCDEGYVLESSTSKRCIPQSDCKKACGGNSSFTDCGTACPLTCDNYDISPTICTRECVVGCFCNEGYVLENATSNHCIPQSDCKKTCGSDASYTDCGTACPLTCDNYDNPPRVCTAQCVAGCFCNEGYVFESATCKRCIPQSDCKKTCVGNSNYTDCGTACPVTCDNYYSPPQMCTLQCVQECSCNEGFVLESAASKCCIPQSDCEKACGDNSRYMDCGTACPLTCDNYHNPPLACTKECAPGCFCTKGYVFENATSKRCIAQRECKKACPDHSQYTDYGTACPLTCANYENPPLVCTKQFVPGCFCEEGYVFESETSKRCIPQNECKKVCPENSQYTDCGSACLLTCDNFKKPQVCTDQCVQGCFCNKGFVLESENSNRCIPQSECKKTCPTNSRYTRCGTACPLTCDNYDNPPQVCTEQCVQGCFCEEGFVLESENSNRCIPQSECKKTCPSNSRYTSCGTACPLTCDNYDNPPQVCTYQCVAGFFCEEGYVFESATSKRCILQKDCRRLCKDNSKYTNCGSACPLTCENLKIPRMCTDQCVPGCFCDDGYVFENDRSDLCVKQSSCKPLCNANAHYEQCGTVCPKTCADVTNPRPRQCPLSCTSGCFCDEGFVLENTESNVCVKEEFCTTCEANSHYNTCASACPLNCQNHRHPPQACPLICLEGCVCKEGHVFKSGQSGPCVPESDCPRFTEQ